ncbi:sporulation protein YunB [Clostridium sp. Mt-5]|uniref:Sporulation protein YunB n=1 Tax=Clostridium moutaii TaxID=3240932 RepID=A0ABV4BNJ9_9CLOT
MIGIRIFKVIDNKVKGIFIIGFILIILGFCIYFVNAKISPAIVTAADVQTRAIITETINSVIIEEYSKQFDYKDIIDIEKDKQGNIVMIRANTLKMNKIACDVAIKCQQRLKNIGKVGLKLPLGYIMKNNLLAFFGPNITVKMQPVGYIETKYLSSFESVGINQSRHKIYVQVNTNMRIIIPLGIEDIKVKNEVPISETIILGKVPETAINLGLDKAGFKIPN